MSRSLRSDRATARVPVARRPTWSCPQLRCAAENTLLTPPAVGQRTRGTATARWVVRAPCLRCGQAAFLSGLSLFDPCTELGEPIDFDVREVEPA